MSALRTRSFRNIKSEENVANYSMLFHKESRVFEEFVPSACRDYDSLYFVFVKKEIIQEDAYLRFYEMDSKAKRLAKKRSMMPTAANNNSDEMELNVPNSALEQALEERNSSDAGAVIFTARYDTLDHLREIYMDRIPVIDNTTITVIRLVSSQYTYLRKITIKRSGINANTIYQVNKMLQISNITEVSLDDLRLPEANYYILLDRASSLKSLSLCRSNINDTVIQEICVRLSYLRPAETHLALLDLTSNDITDVGAAYISRALRTNRHLQYLNLSGNKITDEGACSIFESLMEFPLTVQELFEKRQRLFKFNMKRRATIMGKAFPKATDASKTKDSKAGSTKGAKIKKKKVNSKTSTNEFPMSFVSDNRPIGSLQDPFNVKYMRIINHRSYCMGNFTLVILNLGYNHLTYLGIKKLAEVIAYQSKNKVKEGGLHRVVIDGNYLPTDCPEYVEIDHILG